MLGAGTGFLLMAAFSAACWAQVASGQATASPGFKLVAIAPVLSHASSATPKDNGIPYHCYFFGRDLTLDSFGLAIQNAVADGGRPVDRNGVYFGLTSAN